MPAIIRAPSRKAFDKTVEFIARGNLLARTQKLGKEPPLLIGSGYRLQKSRQLPFVVREYALEGRVFRPWIDISVLRVKIHAV